MAWRGWKFLLGVFVLGWAANASAHNAPGSALLLDFHREIVAAELRLPLSELEIGFGQKLEVEPATVVARSGPELAAYVLRHLSVQTEDRRPWQLAVRDLRVALGEQPIDLVVTVEMMPPAGVSLRRFTLHSDVISHEVMNHFTLVSVRSDWDNALLGTQPELIGTLRSFEKDLLVDRTSGSAWRGFRSVAALGMRHIAEGTDHLIFLLVLLLPAPLLVAGRRWGSYGGFRHSALRLAKIVTAFTLGHSITLALGAFGAVRFPAPPVEVLIAVSILVSAVHAWRPLFPGREPLVAAGFGLVHGLAFASVLADFQLDRWHLASALLAFNLGVELMQLLVVLAAAPALVTLSRRLNYALVRSGGALVAGVAAMIWIGERSFGALGAPLYSALALMVVAVLWIRRRVPKPVSASTFTP